MMQEQPEKRVWKLSPSDFAFLWDECKRCFYLKLVRGFSRPITPFPAVFSKIAGMQKSFFDNQATESLVPVLPSGVFAYGEKNVKSNPIVVPGHEFGCYIAGRFDMVAAFNDGTFGMIDFKTSEPSQSNTEKYSRQLHAYAYALEHPAPGALALSPVSLLGLLVLDPKAMESQGSGKGYYIQCIPKWIPFKRSDSDFLKFIERVSEVLNHPDPPLASPTCSFCNYREKSRATGY